MQAAIDAAAPGATLRLCAGTFPTNAVVFKDLTIAGAGAGATVLDGGRTGSVLTVAANATVVMHNLSVVNGRAGLGGGINSAGKLTLRDSSVTGNIGRFRGAGIHNDTTGTMRLERCRVEGNAADEGGIPRGGGIWNQGRLALVETEVVGNRSVFDGGGLVNFGEATLVDCLIEDNVALDEQQHTAGSGGGIYNEHPGYHPEVGAPGKLEMTNCRIERNRAHAGGGIHNSGGELTVVDSRVSGNTAAFGGGINHTGDLTLRNSIVSENTGGMGGGIVNNSHPAKPLATSTLTLEAGSNIAGNTASSSGGGISNGDRLIVSGGSSVIGNRADFQGGGIWSVGNGDVTIQAEGTVTDNRAGAEGGGIFNDSGKVSLEVGSRVRGNTSRRAGGGIYSFPRPANDGVVAVAADDIVTGNHVETADGTSLNNCEPAGVVSNCAG